MITPKSQFVNKKFEIHKIILTNDLLKHIIVTKATIIEVKKVNEQDKKIFELFSKILPTLTTAEKRDLLAFGEGIAFFKATQQQVEPLTRKTA